MTSLQTDHVRELLERERTWAAYALADLDPPLSADCVWHVGQDGVVLVFRGLEPPVLFAAGAPATVSDLLRGVPAGPYQFTLMGAHRALLADRLTPGVEHKMWRMALHPGAFDRLRGEGAERLSSRDLVEIEGLFRAQPDRPDSFHASQLEHGPFFGMRDSGKLVSVAGTHVVSEASSLAAVGNVFTHPDWRGRRLAQRATAAVVRDLLDRGLRTVVLNVAMDNLAAVRCYERLGFKPFCGYYEGVGQLAPAHKPLEEKRAQ